ncbi:MAG: Copper Transporter integral membrane protein that functions in high affinity copper transport [Lichina confinis]|nr:MAG: Copper Transporter integral membrane protein that functions in high affinity copper transport [Lichina confinis]
MASSMSAVVSSMASMSGMTPTATAACTGTAMACSNHASGHGSHASGHSMMGGGSENTCKISVRDPVAKAERYWEANLCGVLGLQMLWNWNTIDACFIARSWHVRSEGAFAASCIGVILLVISLEFLRRTQREFDKYFRAANIKESTARVASSSGSESESGGNTITNNVDGKVAPSIGIGALGGLRGRASAGAPRPKLWQQLIRSVLYMLQFTVGYFVMLLAMYYNGYIIICIIIGAFLGAMIFQWDTLHHRLGAEQRDSCCN